MNVLVIAAHPDDEVLGCGGTILKHTSKGDRVYCLFLADGESSREAGNISARKKNADQAANVLGISESYYLDFIDNQLDTIPLLKIVTAIETIISQVQPEVIYTHSSADLNVDHAICNKAVLTATRPVPGSKLRAIYAFEILSSTEWNFGNEKKFSPNTFVDITPYYTKKIDALQCYSDEMRKFPHTRSFENMEHLNSLRGANVGFQKAEAFECLRQLFFLNEAI